MNYWSKYTWILDNGHGGIINGQYVTPGKRSPIWPDGSQLFEGVFNRIVVRKIHAMCQSNGIKSVILVPSEKDVSLATRVKEVNKIAKTTPSILVSVHANAGGGTGWEIWTTPGLTKSDAIATEFFVSARNFLPTFKMRTDFSDKDPDKESLFYILRYTNCPAILTENLFMDTYDPDCKFIMSTVGQDIIANLHFDAIQRIENRERQLSISNLGQKNIQ